MGIVNYYEELGLNELLDITALNKELNSLESVWIKRQVTNPEKATKMIALIIEARKAFQNNYTKEQYDKKLKESKTKKDPDADRNKEFLKYKSDAEKYYKNKQYDLAKIALEKAFAISGEGEDTSLLRLASDIYLMNNDYRSALNFINKAIIEAPEEGILLVKKALLLHDMPQNQGSVNNIPECRQNLERALYVAQKNNNKPVLAVSYGWLANTFYYEYPQDKIKAKVYAKKAVDLGEDDFKNGEKILAEFKREEEAEKARIRQEEERKKLAEQAAEQRRIAEEEAEKKRKLEEEHKKNIRAAKTSVNILIIILFICLTAFVHPAFVIVLIIGAIVNAVIHSRN